VDAGQGIGYNSVENVGVLKQALARMRSGASELKPQCSHGASVRSNHGELA